MNLLLFCSVVHIITRAAGRCNWCLTWAQISLKSWTGNSRQTVLSIWFTVLHQQSPVPSPSNEIWEIEIEMLFRSIFTDARSLSRTHLFFLLATALKNSFQPRKTLVTTNPKLGDANWYPNELRDNLARIPWFKRCETTSSKSGNGLSIVRFYEIRPFHVDSTW